ncbi:hypothetical protein [Lawsonibacter faecis]|uniref:Uncharacterized protein n=1 Tax=Lawsonibacter faecis TaxID=2763052 RepID=A0A8J6JME9_9FIRM|nr:MULTISPECIES: hypothetical protein [Oscillospiraceae]MTQ96812.1 hypothetical protein [Pseudoflavonifractor sp. BIOML-A16]MTR05095.1 hypothetical protein [Pseudoflavonifractor sp. BIOML-A15]MTR32716.1 hypothetical protein [Pseudoflavonifractor sp. BIOML-A14]MTR72110.1 hypothetical protein [Pseudoflavonifractor sp. BIOML-A18]MTS65064.1 hypothetical protein [Pseudoflavonifractor sp. BIOML-A5]MTS70452.1 hypothetical protein [Pseudoflavonifractor sp. BIOML-A8]MTS90938.1 hypothetical protein [P
MAAALLYLCNRLFFLPGTTGAVHLFFAWYFSDLLAGALIPAIAALLLILARLPPLTRPLSVTGFALLCGLFWELVTPLYKPGAVCDPLDLPAYLAGAWIYLGLVHAAARPGSRAGGMPRSSGSPR